MPSPVLWTHVLGAAESDAGDAGDTGEVQLLDGLAGLLLVARVDHGGRAGGKAGIAALDIGVVARIILDLDVLNLLLGELFNAGVGHFGS